MGFIDSSLQAAGSFKTRHWGLEIYSKQVVDGIRKGKQKTLRIIEIDQDLKAHPFFILCFSVN